MTERYISYGLGGEMYDVPESESATFEERNPSATIEMRIGKDVFDVPLSEKENFLKVNGDSVSYLYEDENPETKNKKNDKTSVFETIGKGIGAAGVGTAKLALDLGQNLWQQTLGRLDDQTLDETIQNKDNAVTRASMRLGELQERLSREADPTGGEVGFGQLLKEGKIGKAAQKALASGLESLPMMVAAGTGWGALLYGTAMAAGQYADETRENDDIPAWKRGVNAIGSAALEMAVEKIGGPLKNIGGKAGKEFSEEMAKEIMEDFAKEGTEKVAKRIFNTLKKPLKEGLEEGGEELLTSFGNDALGSALDMIDGDKDYGIRAQWEQMKEQNPDADLEDFAKSKANEYIDSFLGGALSGMEIATTADAINLSINRNRQNQIQEARNIGNNLGLQDMYDVEDQLTKAGDEVEKAFVGKDGNSMLSRDFIDGLTADDAYELSLEEDMTTQQKKALLWYAKSKAVGESLTAKMDAELNNNIAAQNKIIDDVQSEGVVVTGVYNNQPVYIKGAVVKNGTISLPDGSGGPVVAINALTGDTSTIRTEDVKMPEAINVDEYRARVEGQIRNNDAHNREVWKNNMSASAKFKYVQQYANSKITVNAGNGLTQVQVLNINPNDGTVLIKGKKGDLGQSELLISADLFYDIIARNEDGSPVFVERLPEKEQAPVVEQINSELKPITEEPLDFREGEHTILINGVPVSVEVQNQDDVADSITYIYTDENGQRKVGRTTVAGFADAVEQAQDYQTEEPISEVSVEEVSEEPVANIPAPEENIELTAEEINWDALFEQDPENYFAELQKRFGEGAIDVINMEIAATEKELNKLEKNQGSTRTERIKNLGKISKLRLEKGILEDMANRLQNKVESEQVTSPEVAANEPIAEPIQAMPEPELVEPAQVGKDPEPRNAVEFAARELGLKNGGIKLLWESFMHHTGYGDGEKRKFFGLFRKKENGGMTLEEAGERLMELDREYGTNFFDQNDPNAGLDAILEAIQSNNTVGDLRTYTRRQYEADAKREADDINNFIMSEYNDALFAEEVVRKQVAENALTEEEHNELDSIFAEDIYDYEKANKRDALPVSGAEDIGDLPVAARETIRGGEGSNRVLQEAQPIQTRGEGDVEEESEAATGSINRENADTPVHNGESSVSERVYPEAEGFVSSLDEDMPDFTTEAPKAPVAPNPVANPVEFAQEEEKKLLDKLDRIDLPKNEKRDWAYKYGKKVADMFATREDYGAYEEVAEGFGEFLKDFNQGVEESFANRPQYHIGNGIANSGVSQEAIDLVNEAVDDRLDGYVEVERPSDETVVEVLELGGIDNQFSVEPNKPIFISNAALAVQGIKMEKATPEQWLKMIEKAGGLKAGEDKWMGLSDWLKASDKKTLTKQEVLDYITANTIQTEEVHYAEVDYFKEDAKLISAINDEFLQLKQEAESSGELPYDAGDIAYQMMVDKYGDDFSIGFGVDLGELYVSNRKAASVVTGVDLGAERVIDETRLGYTTEGLKNYKEIAITVPTIESWNESDEIHFGDAGNGRAVAWVRFGEVEVPVQDANYKRLQEIYDRLAQLGWKIYNEGLSMEEYEERSRLIEERDNLQDVEGKTQRVLVIDEIQSKRHQEGREKGYKSEFKNSKQANALKDSISEVKDRIIELGEDKTKNSEAEQTELARLDIMLNEAQSNAEYDAIIEERDKITAHIENRESELQQLRSELNKLKYDLDRQLNSDYMNSRSAIPDAPFEKNWQELAMKRMLRYAAENGYDAIAWTKGEQQAERYSLAKSFSGIEREDRPDGEGGRRFTLYGGNMDTIYADESGVITSSSISDELKGKHLSDVVGKDMANKMMSLENNDIIDGEDLTIGGEGMKGFYDKMLPAFMDKYGKKWGVKTADIELPNVEKAGRYMHSVPVTEAMRASVMEGQPMFFKTPNGIVYGWTDGKKIYLTKAGMNPNTKIHEYTHLWAKAMMQKNPKGWNSIKQLLKKTPVWNEVMNDANYSNIHGNEDMVTSEVLSRISGTENAAKLERMAQQMIDEAKGTMRKAEARGLVQNIKDALNQFWSWVGKHFLEIENFNSVDEITDRVLWDLVNKTDLQLDTLEDSQIEAQIGKRNPRSFGRHNKYNQIASYTSSFRDDIYFRVLSKYYFDKDASPYVFMDGYFMQIDVPDTESMRYYRNVDKTDGYGIRFGIFVGNVTEEEFDKIINAYERGLLRTPESFGELLKAYRKYTADGINSDNVVIEDGEADINNDGLHRQTQRQAADRGAFVEGGNSYLRTSEINSLTSPISNLREEKPYQEVDNQNAAIDYLADEARLKVIEHAVNTEASKLGVSVTYKKRSDMPTGKRYDKGYYNTKTGEIVICTENASSVADAIQTILHEAVAHKGLRQLMGDKFNEFINRVYNSLDAETKARVDKLAAKQYGGNTAVAMEEYMAKLAESEDFAKNSVWEKIKSIFEDIMNSLLGRNDIKIGDNELRYILRASYNNMVNPNSMSTIEGWAKDTNMRNELGINEATPEILSRTGVDPTEVAATSARQVYDRVVNERWNEFQRQFQDAYQPVRVAIEAIQAETGNIPVEDYENYPLVQNQSSSRSRVEIDNFQRKYYKPIIKQVNKIIDEVMKSRGLNKRNKSARAQVYQEVRQYLIAKHGLERNAYYQNAKGEMRDFAGLTGLFGLPATDYQIAEQMAQDVVDSFEALIGDAARDTLWDKINSATDKTLRHSYESGLISRQQYNDIKAMFNFYIPLRGFDETTAEDVYAYARFEGNRFNPAVQKAEGRTSVADDPIAIIMNMAESEIAQGNKNRAKQALYNYLLNRATANNGQNSLMQLQDVWFTITTDAFGNKIYQIAAPNFAAGETYEQFEARMLVEEAAGNAVKSKKGQVDVGMKFQKQMHKNAHYVYLKINGVDKAIFINGDPKAADAINGTFQQKKQFAEDKMRAISRVISSTFTNYSLEFTARNYFRDMVYSHINIGVRESDPAYRKKFRQNWRHNNLGTMIKMLNAYRSGEYDSRPLTADEAAFVEFMNNGGQTGYTLINSVENHKKELQYAIERMQNGIDKGGVKDSTVFKYTLGAIELLNESSELVTRFAAFKTSRDMGRSIETSISDAKEVTVNFNTKGAQDGVGFMGAVARYFGWSKYFFNASVQGVQNLKAMSEANKLKFCGVVGGMVATGFMMPVITAAIFELLGGDDDEEEYWNIPEYDRQNNLCIALGNGKYAKIPLPIGFREVYAIGDMVAAMLMDKKFSRDFGQVGMDIANKISSVVLPVNPLESSVNGLSIMHSIAYVAAPSSAQFVIQELSNTDWKGAPIQKEYTYNEDDPQWMKAYASNPEWMTMLSKWCNEHIGDSDMKGWDWSPEKLDNRLSNIFGGVYTLIKKSGRSISMIWNEEQRNLSNIPLAGVVLGSGIDSDDRFITDAYFDMKDYYDERIGFIERRAKTFGLTLDDVFVEMLDGHQPKMQEIYSNKNFDFMQEWYLGNKELEKMKNKIEKEEKRAAKEGLAPEDNTELAALQNEYEAERRDFVNDMLELD